jgi:DNA-binding response OmpR family regulator
MKHILAVDDQPSIRRLVEINLGKAGYRVTTASDGREALDQIAAERPDMVVLDVTMPEVDGYEVLRRLREDEETADLPVLMLSGRTRDFDIARAWRTGADTYLPKPFDPRQLLSTVEHLLDEPAELCCAA